jgi:ABC-type nitrate/sulfonate/bicarbonate transport system substrate-binding protein
VAVHGPQYVPDGAGWWKAAGLSVNTENVNGSLVSVSALQAGQADLMEATGETIAPAVAQGAGLISVYQETYSPTYSWVFPPESQLKVGPELKGATIGVSTLGAGSYALAKAALATYGLDWQKDVHIVATGTGSGGYVALQNHRVDALLWITSQLSQFDRAGVKFKYQRLGAYRHRYPGAVNAVTLATLKDASKRAAVVTYLRGVTRALKLCEGTLPTLTNANTTKCIDDYKASTGDKTTVGESVSALAYSNDDYQLPRKAYGRYGYSEASYWTTIQKSQVAGGLLDKAQPVSSLFTNALLKDANQGTCARTYPVSVATDSPRPTADGAELWTGLDQGFYGQEGVKLTVSKQKSAAAAVQSVLSARSDLALVPAKAVPAGARKSVVVAYQSSNGPHAAPGDVFVTTKRLLKTKPEALGDFFRGFTNSRHFCQDQSRTCAASYLKASGAAGSTQAVTRAIATRNVGRPDPKALTGRFTSRSFAGLTYDNSLLKAANGGACAQ